MIAGFVVPGKSRLLIRGVGPALRSLGVAAPLAEPPLSLDDVRYDTGRMSYASHRHHAPEARLAGYLAEARQRLSGPPSTEWPAVDPQLDADFEALRWFPLPSEALSATASPPPDDGQPIR